MPRPSGCPREGLCWRRYRSGGESPRKKITKQTQFRGKEKGGNLPTGPVAGTRRFFQTNPIAARAAAAQKLRNKANPGKAMAGSRLCETKPI
jgi:hypothetical protein